ncbi:hypothetical protein AMTR_s00067p00155430 [Amborella trichopoda]|uniref:Transmembrane protein n=1 Tax=Amborella trichopoda TaxID=13333 RepID=U5DEP9_AMBTC|nr:hypothetical protein AMTR_s00067p00155430 [Amborella trichopoda]
MSLEKISAVLILFLSLSSTFAQPPSFGNCFTAFTGVAGCWQDIYMFFLTGKTTPVLLVARPLSKWTPIAGLTSGFLVGSIKLCSISSNLSALLVCHYQFHHHQVIRSGL